MILWKDTEKVCVKCRIKVNPELNNVYYNNFQISAPTNISIGNICKTRKKDDLLFATYSTLYLKLNYEIIKI